MNSAGNQILYTLYCVLLLALNNKLHYCVSKALMRRVILAPKATQAM